jgi:hypothetical protein
VTSRESFSALAFLSYDNAAHIGNIVTPIDDRRQCHFIAVATSRRRCYGESQSTSGFP